MKIVPGDLGTKGGLLTDERARVLRPDGSVIPGLYAAGNVSAAVMGYTYAGPGATIGPALVFGYLAVEDISTRRTVSDAHRPVRRDRGRRRLPHLLLDRERRAALPPRHRRRVARGRQPLPRRAATHPRRSRRCRCCRRSESWCRPSTRPTRRRSTCPGCDINLAQVVHGVAVDLGVRPAPHVGHRDAVDDAHRHLGQGQGRRHLAGGRRPLASRARSCGGRARRSSSRARAAGAATAVRRSPWCSPSASPTC